MCAHKKIVLSIFITGLLFSFISSNCQTITTVAGNGISIYGGDGGLATTASLKNRRDMCTDGSGNLYIADYTDNRIRKVDAATGIIRTIAGDGVIGYSGDGGPAIAARFNGPISICIDKSGNLYITDQFNYCIRKIDAATGTITTIAGVGISGYSGDGGLAVNAKFGIPIGLAIDAADNLYVCDDERIRRIDAATGIITTVAGNGIQQHKGDGGLATAASLAGPVSICVDNKGHLYIGNYADTRIRKVDATTGIITTIAGTTVKGYSGDGGLAINASLNYASGISIDSEGNIYIADVSNNRIRRIDAITGIITTVAGTGVGDYTGDGGPAVNADLSKPTDICIYQNNLYLADFNNYCVRKITNPCNPSISISASAAAICVGQEITFTSVSGNEGSNPVYQWKVNGVNVGANSTVFKSNVWNNGDIVSCELSSSSSCGTIPVSSNIITIQVMVNATPEVTISANTLTICEGEPVTFTATNQSGHINPAYQWQVDGMNVGTNSPVFTTPTLANGATVQCIMTVPHCVSGTTKDFSDPIKMTVNPLPGINFNPSSVLLDAGQQYTLQPEVKGAVSTFSWTPAVALVHPAVLNPLTLPLHNTTTYRLSVISTQGCEASKELTITVFKKLHMPTSFSPNGDGLNDLFRIPPGTTLTLQELTVYDRWGNQVFSTNDASIGWNGTYNGRRAPIGNYVYYIKATTPKGDVSQKGTVTLVR